MTMRQPDWITDELSPNDIAAINQGGCESGAYMPAVTYCEAAATMSRHGDDVLDFIEEHYGAFPSPPDDVSWDQRACFYLSIAVESFCACYEYLADWENCEPIDWSEV
jgi:hypothetical protein